jgi:hypothetical protein
MGLNYRFGVTEIFSRTCAYQSLTSRTGAVQAKSVASVICMRLRCGRSAIIRIRKNPHRMPSSSLHIWERIRHALTHLRHDSHRPSFTICAAWVRNTEPRTLSPRPSFAEIDSRPRTSRGRTDRIWENQKSAAPGADENSRIEGLNHSRCSHRFRSYVAKHCRMVRIEGHQSARYPKASLS